MKDNDKKKRYLFVECDDIKRATYEVERQFSFNDFDNVYHETGSETASAIFDANGIPDEYRKIVIKINIPQLFSAYEAEDYIARTPFDITGYTRFRKGDSPKIISGRTVSSSLEGYVSFNTPKDFKTYDDVMRFYEEMKETGLLESYIASVSEFFARVPVKAESIEKIKEYVLRGKDN